MTFICYCEPGDMSRCVANGLKEQCKCHFFNKSMAAERCMHLNQSMNSHCWSNKAQDNGLCLPDDSQAAEQEGFTEEEIEEMLAPVPDSDKKCHDCLHFACSYVIQTHANTPGGLRPADFRMIATACGKFEFSGDGGV